MSILDKFDAIADPSTQTISKQQLVGLLREGEPSAAAAAADDDEDLGEFEVIVIGGGPTGVTAALRAAYLGRKALQLMSAKGHSLMLVPNLDGEVSQRPCVLTARDL